MHPPLLLLLIVVLLHLHFLLLRVQQHGRLPGWSLDSGRRRRLGWLRVAHRLRRRRLELLLTRSRRRRRIARLSVRSLLLYGRLAIVHRRVHEGVREALVHRAWLLLLRLIRLAVLLLLHGGQSPLVIVHARRHLDRVQQLLMITRTGRVCSCVDARC